MVQTLATKLTQLIRGHDRFGEFGQNVILEGAGRQSWHGFRDIISARRDNKVGSWIFLWRSQECRREKSPRNKTISRLSRPITGLTPELIGPKGYFTDVDIARALSTYRPS